MCIRDRNKGIEQMKGRLIVSCQALPEEPLHSSYITVSYTHLDVYKRQEEKKSSGRYRNCAEEKR